MKSLKWVLIFLSIGLLGLIWLNYPKLTIISGYAAKNMASTVFVAGRTPESVTSQDHQVPLIKLAATEYSPEGKEAYATVFGLMKRQAYCRDGLGCVLLPKETLPPTRELAPNRNFNQSDAPYPYGSVSPVDTIFPEVDYPQLKRALDLAFLDNTLQRSRSVLVLYKGHILAERYEGGMGPDTPILGWSMTKSILATLYGILAYQGDLQTGEPAGVPAWQGDSRKLITLDNLLRMNSGLAWEEDYTSISDVTRMLFLEPDMAGVQMGKEAIAAPGAVWNYSSGTSNLLAGLLGDQFASHQDYLDFPYSALIDKIGMHSMLLETDLTGTFVGSSYGWASTRDWGRFGQLYLNRGSWDGKQIFDSTWVDYVTRPTPGSDGRYGAHFWLNAGEQYPGVPRDLFSANGYQGQYVFIIPSLELVVVRTGLAEPPDFKLPEFLRALISSVPKTPEENPS